MIIPLTCIPPIGILKIACKAQELIVDGHEHYQKQTFRNRYHILNANGEQTLSIGVIGQKGEKVCTKDVKIDHAKPWSRNHIRSIRSAYGSSPYFEYYINKIENLLLTKHETIGAFFDESFPFWLNLLNVELNFSISKNYIERTDELDFRKPIKRTDQIDKVKLPPYVQVFSDRFNFMQNLSVIDLIFNLGPESSSYLQGYYD